MNFKKLPVPPCVCSFCFVLFCFVTVFFFVSRYMEKEGMDWVPLKSSQFKELAFDIWRNRFKVS